MGIARTLVAVGDQPKCTVHGLQFALCGSFDQRLGTAAVLNKIGDSTNSELMRSSELNQIRQARHFAVVLQHFADHRRRNQSCEMRQVATGLRVPGAHQHAALLRHQRKNVTRLHDVFRLRVLSDCRQYRACAIGRGNAGRHAARGFDRQREIRSHARAVVADHQRQSELPATLLGERQANQPAPMLGHEVNGLRRHEFGGHQQIALIFAFLFVHKDDQFSGSQVGNDLGYGADCRHCMSWVNSDRD